MGDKQGSVDLPSWVDKDNPEEVKAFELGVRAGRSGKPMPEKNRKYYVVVYNGWVEGRRLREQKEKPE